jgi:hypothetical protein
LWAEPMTVVTATNCCGLVSHATLSVHESNPFASPGREPS